MLFRPLISVAAVLLFVCPGIVVADFQYDLLMQFYYFALDYENSQYAAVENSQANYPTSSFSYLQDLQHGNSPSSEELASHTAIINDLAIMLNAPTREALRYPNQTAFNAIIDGNILQVCPGQFSCDDIQLTGVDASIYRTITGICNNRRNPLYGSAFSSQPRFNELRGSWERMGLVNYRLTQPNVLFDTKYIGATPVLDKRPFLVKVRGESTLRISLFDETEREVTEDENCDGICSVGGMIISVTIIGNNGNCRVYFKPNTDIYRVEGSDCADRTFRVRFYPFIADIRLQSTSNDEDSTLAVSGTVISSASGNKFRRRRLHRYWINLYEDSTIHISEGTEFSESAVFLTGSTAEFSRLRNVFVAIGTEGSTLTTEFAIRDIYEVATNEAECVYPSYGFVDTLNHIPWVYSFYRLRFGVRQSTRGQFTVTLIGAYGEEVTLTVDNNGPEFASLTARDAIQPYYNQDYLSDELREDFTTAAGERYNRYDALWLAWYDNYVYFGTGNQIALNIVTETPLILKYLSGSLDVVDVKISSTTHTEWVFDIEQINKPRVSSLHTGESLPSALDVALELLTERGDTKWSTDVTLMTFQWGQFLDHDLIATPAVSVDGHAPECCSNGQPVDNASFSEEACFNIPVNNDILSPRELRPFDASTTACLTFVRSANILDCSEDPSSVDDRLRQPMNIITSWLDASNVYESRTAQSESLREEDSAKMKVLANPKDQQDELPLATEEGEACAVNNRVIQDVTVNCRHAGDFRSQEQMSLNGMHTLFVREHNRLVDILKEQGYTDNTNETREELFQVVRHIVAAEMQVITYKNFLPSFLSDDTITSFDLEFDERCRYNDRFNGGIHNLWGIIFRMGHDWIPNDLVGDPNTDSVFEDAIDSLPLINNFFNSTTSFLEGGSDSVMLNLHKACPLTDGKMESTVEFHLFGNVNGTFIENTISGNLGALNIQRGRDHGVETYQGIRRLFRHLSVPANIDDLNAQGIVSNATRDSLKKLYHGIEDIDAFLSGMMELPNPAGNGLSGDIINNVLGAMFRLLKRGDQFWYSCYFSRQARRELEKVTIGRIMCDNIGGFDTEATQEDLFLVYNQENNGYIDCADRPELDYTVFSKTNRGGRLESFGNNAGSTGTETETGTESETVTEAATETVTEAATGTGTETGSYTERELDMMEKLLELAEELKGLTDEDKK